MQTGRYEFQTEFARKYVALGRSQGREEGREEGSVDSLRRTLARQLAVKFGPEALAPVQARVDTAGVETLEQWLERIITAATIDGVFGNVT